MPNRPGWPQLGGNIPQFVEDHFTGVRDAYRDLHGIAPTQTIGIAALMLDADREKLLAAMRKLNAECESRDVNIRS
jgi:hypothetical protein